eukprot:10801081-Karenia_brevis.AAC.1
MASRQNHLKPQVASQEAQTTPTTPHHNTESVQLITHTEQDWARGPHGTMSLAEMLVAAGFEVHTVGKTMTLWVEELYVDELAHPLWMGTHNDHKGWSVGAVRPCDWASLLASMQGWVLTTVVTTWQKQRR